jgi:hypothetical protein
MVWLCPFGCRGGVVPQMEGISHWRDARFFGVAEMLEFEHVRVY